MSELKIGNVVTEPSLVIMREVQNENQSFFDILNNAFYDSIAKRVAFKQLSCNGVLLGYYVASLSRFSIPEEVKENYDDYKYYSVHLDLIYILPQYRKRNIGKVAMHQFLLFAKNVSSHTGCRFVTLDAINGLEEWYTQIGFVKTNITSNMGFTTKMFIDMRDQALFNSFEECP